jgi:hypothetical protein
VKSGMPAGRLKPIGAGVDAVGARRSAWKVGLRFHPQDGGSRGIKRDVPTVQRPSRTQTHVVPKPQIRGISRRLVPCPEVFATARFQVASPDGLQSRLRSERL